MSRAPIALFIYNRPEHAARTLSALAANPGASDSDLVIYADGPKRPDHAASVKAARDVARSVTGFRTVRLVEREQNLGLANSIITGVSELCAERGRVIVVEDDLVVAPGFLGFLNEGLDRYAGDEGVLQLSGYSYPIAEGGLRPAYFLPMISCWGWATWDRAWRKFDVSMAALPSLDSDTVARSRFNIDDSYDYYGMACDQRAGRIDSWGVRWQLSLFSHDGLVLYPRNSLVYNAGTDSSGTHGAGHSALQNASAADAAGTTVAWPQVDIDGEALDRVKQLIASQRPSLLRRLIQRIRR